MLTSVWVVSAEDVERDPDGDVYHVFISYSVMRASFYKSFGKCEYDRVNDDRIRITTPNGCVWVADRRPLQWMPITV